MIQSTQINILIEERYQFCIWLYRIAKQTKNYILTKPCHIKGLFGDFIKTPLYTKIVDLPPYNGYTNVYNIVHNNHYHDTYIDNDYLNIYNISMFDNTNNTKTIRNVFNGRDIKQTSNILIHDNKAYIGLFDYTELDNPPWWYRIRNDDFGWGNPIIYVWNMETNQKIVTLFGHRSVINCLAIYEDKLYSGSKDNTICVWNTDTYQTITTLIYDYQYAINGSVKCLTIHNNKLYSGCEDSRIYVWNIVTYENIKVLNGHLEGVNCLTIYENKLYSGGNDYAICIWDIDTYKLLSILKGHSSSVNCLTIYENKLYSGSSDCAIRVWDIKTNENIAAVIGHYNEVIYLTICDKKLCSVSNDNAISVWKI